MTKSKKSVEQQQLVNLRVVEEKLERQVGLTGTVYSHMSLREDAPDIMCDILSILTFICRNTEYGTVVGKVL